MSVSEGVVFAARIKSNHDATALTFPQLLTDRWATVTAEQTTRDAGSQATAALLTGLARAVSGRLRAARRRHRTSKAVTLLSSVSTDPVHDRSGRGPSAFQC
ncbi:DUF6207 family protein [Streptomyces sp. NPDC005263]|uniref:DUF6207 family protein n=1 Tax=Streptomyces sp. NPDC005263 TaxID=3364711 RepID=UPI0036C58A51